LLFSGLLKNTLFALRQAQGERKRYCEQGGFPFVVSLSNHDILIKAYNLWRNLFEERVSLIETAAVKPD
jgi:hypothetical protein